jgi:hypothetical protein
MRRTPIAAAVAWLSLGAGVANAAQDRIDEETVRFAAAPGETNAVSVGAKPAV